MTGRERLTAILNKKPTDRMPWTTDPDRATLRGLPESLQGNSGFDFYRHIGCDIFLFNGVGDFHFCSPELRWDDSVRTVWEKETQTRKWITPVASLINVTERLVES